jgi:Ca2+-binding EF-hand superfamily protein
MLIAVRAQHWKCEVGAAPRCGCHVQFAPVLLTAEQHMQVLSTSQLGELRQSFDASDANGDGWIVCAEFATLLQTLDRDLSEAECSLAFDSADSDGDGAISFEEFMRWWLS